MTAQLTDGIKFEGRVFEMASEPLAFWLARRKNIALRFRRIHTVLSRGYVSSWEVSKGRLYLTKFTAEMVYGTPVTVKLVLEVNRPILRTPALRAPAPMTDFLGNCPVQRR